MAQWVNHWVDNSSKRRRKDLSHSGAIRWRLPSDPVDYTSPSSGIRYFDPGNDVYARALLLVADEGTLTVSNIGALGDICEGWLALGIMRETRDDIGRKQMRSLAA